MTFPIRKFYISSRAFFVIQFTILNLSKVFAAVPIEVADIKFSIPGSLEVATWQSNNPGMQYPDNPTCYYAFEKGDTIVLNFDLGGQKGTNIISVSTFPDKEIRYSNNNFSDLKEIKIPVEDRAIYRFAIATNYAFVRTGHLILKRIPASVSTASFKTAVRKRTKYVLKEVQPIEKHFINSGSNATFKNGKSRVLIPVALPKNTVRWYYTVYASRNQDEVEKTSREFNLLGQLAKLFDASGVLKFGIDQLTQPPGSDYCDIYLLDGQNATPFEQKIAYQYYREGTRENVKSGLTEITSSQFLSGDWYIGLKNPDSYYGITAAIQIVAVVSEVNLEMED